MATLGAASTRGGEAKAAFILALIAISESVWVYWNGHYSAARFFRYADFNDAAGAGIAGWALAFLVAGGFIYFALHLPAVRAHLLRPSWLKLLALWVALASGLCEEIIFRKWLMDMLQHHGSGIAIQIAGSALAFGFAHAVWGLFRGSIRAAMGAMIATGGLGLALAVVYAVGHRIVLPCIVAHFLINLFIEPGLVLAAVRGEMSSARSQAFARE